MASKIKKITVQNTTYDIQDATIVATSNAATKTQTIQLAAGAIEVQGPLNINTTTGATDKFLNEKGSFGTITPSEMITKDLIDTKIGAKDAANADKLYVGAVAGGSWTADVKTYIDGKILANAAANANKMYIGGGVAGGVWEAKPTMTASLNTTTSQADSLWNINGSSFGITVKEGTQSTDPRKLIVSAGTTSFNYDIPKASAVNTSDSRKVTINGKEVPVPTASASVTANASSVKIDGKVVNVPTVIANAGGVTVNGAAGFAASINSTDRIVSIGGSGITIPYATTVTSAAGAGTVTYNGQSLAASLVPNATSGAAININGSEARIPVVATNSIQQGTVTYNAKAALGCASTASTNEYMDHQGNWQTVASVNSEGILILP